MKYKSESTDIYDVHAIVQTWERHHHCQSYNEFAYHTKVNNIYVKIFQNSPNSLKVYFLYTLFYKKVVYKKVYIDWPKP